MTIKLALIGHPITQSLSPPMHKAALAFYKLAGDYELIDVSPDKLEQAVQDLVSAGYKGFQVTVPHKEKIIPLLDALDPGAKLIGAVNTVCLEAAGEAKKGPILRGYNTDILGFRGALLNLIGEKRKAIESACLVGTGGAARSGLWAICQLKETELSNLKTLFLVARNKEKGEVLRQEICQRGNIKDLNLSLVAASDLETEAGMPLNNLDLIVNSTSIGMGQSTDTNCGQFQCPQFLLNLLAANQSDKERFFADMVYSKSPEPTPLVSEALRHGFKAGDGKDMLIGQAAAAFQIWLGKEKQLEPDTSALEKIMGAALAKALYSKD